MKTCALLIASALSVSAALASQARFRSADLPRDHQRVLASTSTFPSDLKSVPNDDAYHMEPVHVVHARVEASVPVWDAEHGLFVPPVGTTFEERFRAGLDTANTVSVEGALMYVQSEGINYATRGDDKCTRTNDMKYVVLYEMVVAQTNETLAEYGGTEYGPYLAMNDGQCEPSGTDANGDLVFPQGCNQLDGTNGEPNIGPFVGAKQRSMESSAPYKDVWQYSFPNTCPLEKWGEKTDACRAKSRVAGLCPYDTKPDGVACTYNYRVLGWVPLDDLVGITQLKAADGETSYADFAAFCAAGGVEFNVTPDGKWVDGLAFWEDPKSYAANTDRVNKLVTLYNDAVKGEAALSQVSAEDLANFKSLPSASELTGANPPCYKNVRSCAESTYGCNRSSLGQYCATCGPTTSECVVAPEGFVFPTLTAATTTPEPTTEAPATPEPTTVEPETPAPTTKEPDTPEPTTPEPTTPEPTTEEPTTPEPTTATPEPTTATPEPTTATPEPTTATPEPTTATPEPTTATPEPTTATPEPTTADPTTPEPTTEEPKTPEPTTPEPTTSEPSTPEPTTEEPTTAVPEDPTTEDPNATFAPAELPTETPTDTTEPTPTTTSEPTPTASAEPTPTTTAEPTSVPSATVTASPASNSTTSKSEKDSAATPRLVVTGVALVLSFVASCLIA